MQNSFRSYTYTEVLQTLRKRLREPAPARAQILAGPRQVGKTTLLGEIADERTDQAIYAPADTPESSLSGWWENLWSKTERDLVRIQSLNCLDLFTNMPSYSLEYLQ